MDHENYIKFLFNNSYEFISVDITGNMSLYTEPDNFIGRNIKDVLPENVSSLTILMINKCIETGENQEYDYELSGQIFHSVLNLCAQGITAIITEK